WHRCSEWRSRGEWRSARDAAAFTALVMSRTSEYCTMGRAVERVVRGRNILNVCGELNAHAHYDVNVSGPFNQGTFGAAYYAASLLQLIRGGTDLELRWSGSDAPVFLAKMLVAHLVPRGSRLRIASAPWLDSASVEDPDGNDAAIIVHKQ